MKKRFLTVLICIFVAILVCGCNQLEIILSKYESHITDIANDGILQSAATPLWNCDITQNPDAKDSFTVRFEGKSVTGTYQYSQAEKGKAYSLDYYENSGISFAIRSDTGKLSSIFFVNKSFYETEPFLADLPDPENAALNIAQKVASKYIDLQHYTLEPVSSSNYTTQNGGKQGQYTGYSYRFVRYINGLPSTDMLFIAVSSKGNILSFALGDIGAYHDITEKSFTISKANQSIAETLDKIYEAASSQVVSYEIESQELCHTPDGQIAILSRVKVKVLDSKSTEWITGVEVTTVLSP